jgi:gliding motility-associated-like protein
MKRLFILAAVLMFGSQAFATHLMGGNVCYENLGYDSAKGKYIYLVKAWIYRDASGSTASCPGTFSLNVYNNNPPTYSSLSGSPFSLPQITNQRMPLPGSECGFSCIGCTPVDECYYEGTIELAPSLSGYHLVWSSCCRNGAIVNLQNPLSLGQTYHAFIPPTYFENSSPCFNVPPVPWICKGDTFCMNNSAYDPDGDQLVFKFVDALNSGGSVPNFPSVPYAPGYYDSLPFGPGSYAFINGITGLTCLMAPNKGNYVISVFVNEYRNGVWLSATRREIQVLVIDCPPQEPPKFVSLDTAGLPIPVKSTFTITEGDTLCFDIEIADEDGDTITMKATGDIFDPGMTNPPATLTPSAVLPDTIWGDSTVVTSFCWLTACGQDRQQPYTFTVTGTDNGCPAKTATKIYAVYVNPATFPPDVILGESYVCVDQTITYTISDTSDEYTYEWTSIGGTVIGSNTKEQYTVKWPSTPTVGTIQVIKRKYCAADTLFKVITIDNNGNIHLGPDTVFTVCPGETVQITSVPFDASYNYRWRNFDAGTTISDTTVHNPIISADSPAVFYLTGWKGTCFGEAKITINIGVAPTIWADDDTICRGHFTQLHGHGGETYEWTPDSGLNDAFSEDPIASPQVTTNYILKGYSPLGCPGYDTITLTVLQEPANGIIPETEVSINQGGSYTVLNNFTTGSSYVWTPDDGTISNASDHSPTLSPSETTTYTLTVQDGPCEYIDTIRVIVVSEIQVPNVFTPNGDGFNDMIRAFGAEGTTHFEFKIFNRWGKVVFETSDIEIEWDGRFNTEPQPMGTYTYYILAEYETGDVVTLNGNITLVR